MSCATDATQPLTSLPEDAALEDAVATTGCDALDACCPDLIGNARVRCMDAVQSGDGARCDQALEVIRSFDHCIPGSDASFWPDVGALGPMCRTLQECCPGLGTLEPQCKDIVALAGERACSALLPDAGDCISPDR